MSNAKGNTKIRANLFQFNLFNKRTREEVLFESQAKINRKKEKNKQKTNKK